MFENPSSEVYHQVDGGSGSIEDRVFEVKACFTTLKKMLIIYAACSAYEDLKQKKGICEHWIDRPPFWIVLCHCQAGNLSM